MALETRERRAEMSELDELVNACLMPGFTGSAFPEWVGDGLGSGLAGVCVYGQNLRGAGSAPERIRELSSAVRQVRPDALVALDEEGGDVTRLEYLVGSSYPGNLALGVVDDVALTEAVATAIGADLRRAGVNVNFAPSVDVNSDPRNPVIGVRSFGADPDLVARHGVAYLRGMHATGVAATAKHFPGHGATSVDSHLGLPAIDADEATFRRRELPPFAAAVEAGVDLVMTSHVVFTALDSQPATLSRRLLVDLLRGELGFRGVVVTDALDMAGVRDAHGIAGAAALSMTAGADLLLLGAEDGEQHCADIRQAIAEHVRDGRLPESRLREAADRVTELRRRLAEQTAVPQAADGVGERAARSALRLRAVEPLTAPAVVLELRASANMAVGNAKWGIAEALDRRGLLARAVTVTDGVPVDVALTGADGAPLVVAVRDAYRSDWQAGWLRRLVERRPDAIVVAVGMPDDADLVPGAVITSHGAARVSTEAVADALAGRASP